MTRMLDAAIAKLAALPRRQRKTRSGHSMDNNLVSKVSKKWGDILDTRQAVE
jgi:hypothetical protein